MALERLRAQLMNEGDLYPAFTIVDPLKKNIIEGLVVGTTFNSRKELSQKGVHAPTTAGISGTQNFGAKSVVCSGKYEDDGDNGDVILYTGTGGKHDSFNESGPQVEDQTFDHPMNKHLVKSFETQIPIRVIRGPTNSPYAPSYGYRYDGMYKVTQCYLDKGRSGYAVCRFRLERLPGQPPIPMRK